MTSKGPMNILIMTATITPKADVRSLGRKDPALRRKDYEDALWFYGRLVGQCIDQIVFVENSESDLSSLKAIAEQLNIVDKIEFISFPGLDYPQMYGRGYGELFLLDHAMANSRFIRECDADTPIWKVTGRYVVLNLARLIQKTPKGFDFYVNMRNYPKRVVDMYMMAWTKAGYRQYLQGKCKLYEETSAAAFPEKALRDDFEAAPRTLKFVPRFRTVPLVSGIRGLDNKGYATDNIWKFYIRVALDTVCPWLWI